MKSLVICLILFFAIISSTSFAADEALEELIAYDLGKKIVIVDFSGVIKKEIEMPSEIKGEFCLKDDIICFEGKGGMLNWYDWKNMREKIVPKGPYFFESGKILGIDVNYGIEVYTDIDISIIDEQIIFEVRPEYEIQKLPKVDGFISNQDELKTPYYDLTEASRLGLLDLKKQKAITVTPYDYCWAPLFYKSKIFFLSVFVAVILDRKDGGEINLSNLYKIKYKITGRHVYLTAPRMIDNELLLAEFRSTDKSPFLYPLHKRPPRPYPIEKIFAYNLDSGEFRIIHDFAKMDNEKKPKLSWALAISKDARYLMSSEKNKDITNIYLIDLEDFSRKKILELVNPVAKPKFYLANGLSQ